jgi:phenylalanyl-tRNA synthetase alpha chain
MENLLKLVDNLKEEIKNFLTEEKDKAEAFRIKFLGSNGSVKSAMAEMKNVAPENKREMGKVLNELKLFAENKYEELKKENNNVAEVSENNIDLSLPGESLSIGTRHQISIVRNNCFYFSATRIRSSGRSGNRGRLA